ncbi:hypothetical protein ACJJI4_02470 [Microbulbifer sp. TRSA002]|uniref:hypothetical protein n=1 Tax=Microbulbifer sp. TRSA002 TaxID=3243382 RepID=UPI00403A1FDE
MTTKTNKPLSDKEKQFEPQKGEVSPEDARTKATIYAAQVKAQMKSKGAKLK